MSLNESILGELQYETKVTRSMLERVPEDKLTWKPHEKSMSLGQLTSHIAEIPGWTVTTIEDEELDFAKSNLIISRLKLHQELNCLKCLMTM